MRLARLFREEPAQYTQHLILFTGKSSHELISALAEEGCQVTNVADALYSSELFTPRNFGIVPLARTTPQMLGITRPLIPTLIPREAELSHGLTFCPLDSGANVLLTTNLIDETPQLFISKLGSLQVSSGELDHWLYKKPVPLDMPILLGFAG